MKNILERFERYVMPEPNSGCWFWMGGLSAGGYGQITFSNPKTTKKAHRVAWELHRGPVPAGLELDHLCRMRSCVTPDHLEPVTRRENTLRGEGVTSQNAHKTHCVNGHPLSGRNLLVKSGWRTCRACQAKAALAFKHRHSLALIGAKTP
jgi:hypothetical protein